MTERLDDLLRRALGDAVHPVGGTGSDDATPQALLAAGAAYDRALRHAGLLADEPVFVTVRNRPADLGAFLGVWLAGGVAVPVHGAAASTTWQNLKTASAIRFRLEGGSVERIASSPPPARPLLKGAALVLFTSGSTGTPKGVVIAHAAFAGKLAVLGRLVRLAPSDHVIVPLQLTFIFGLWVSLLCLLSGAKLTLVSRFSPETAVHALAGGGAVLAAVPSMLRAILAAPEHRAPDLRLILTGGEALGPALAIDLATAFPLAGLYDLYGLTETGSCDFHLAPDDAAEGLGTLGQATEGVAFRIANGNEPVGEGEVGELQIRTPFGMLGYLDQPDLTMASFADGFLRTGDLVRMRADCRVELVGRSKEIISRGGNKIAPLELDNLLNAHPDVAAALCAGIPDARLGQAIHAMVVAKAGRVLLPEGLRHWLGTRTERFKIPDIIEIVDTLPTGPTGKASRTALADLVLQRRGR